MKKWLLFFSWVCFAHILHAQGPQQLVTVPIGPGSTVPGWLYLPADYATSGKNYPVVLFYHGSGEAGTNPNLVLNNGIPRLIADGMRPDNIINPTDGQAYSFIVLSPQHWSWSPSPDWIPSELAWLKQNYRIDTNRIYVTGLSAGGQESFNAVTYNSDVSKLIAAAVPMSPAALGPYDITMVGTYHIKTWFLSGSTDPFTNNAQAYYNQCNGVYPNSSKLTVYAGGHCCWRTYYNITWHDTITGLSIWEWLLTNQRQSLQVLPVHFTDFKATDLGNKRLQVEFSYADPDEHQKFYIRLWIRGVVRDILVSPEDKIGTNRYRKIINLEQ
jgi:hypothetical protein